MLRATHLTCGTLRNRIVSLRPLRQRFADGALNAAAAEIGFPPLAAMNAPPLRRTCVPGRKPTNGEAAEGAPHERPDQFAAVIVAPPAASAPAAPIAQRHVRAIAIAHNRLSFGRQQTLVTMMPPDAGVRPSVATPTSGRFPAVRAMRVDRSTGGVRVAGSRCSSPTRDSFPARSSSPADRRSHRPRQRPRQAAPRYPANSQRYPPRKKKTSTAKPTQAAAKRAEPLRSRQRSARRAATAVDYKSGAARQPASRTRS